jgi:GcrA cell cycle regulator
MAAEGEDGVMEIWEGTYVIEADFDNESIAREIASPPKPSRRSNQFNPRVAVPSTVSLTFDRGAWTDLTIEALRELWRLGYSTSAIGDYLGITKNGIVGKAHRLELDSRPSPIRPNSGTARKHHKAIPPRAPTLPPLPSGIVVPTAQPRVAPTFRPGFNFVRPIVALPRPVEMPRPAMPLTAKCTFPLWDDGPVTHQHCNKPAPFGDSWCPDCRKRVFVRMRDRREDYAAC